MVADSKRLVSLDVFRGFTIFSMLLVNNPANDMAYPSWFRHARWGQGLTFCDMILPWFLFIMGVAIPFSFSSFLKRKGSRFLFLLKSLRRSFVLILLGIIINCSISRAIVVKMDVLQLLGFSYIVSVLIYFLPRWFRICVSVFLIIGYYVLLKFIPFGGNPGGTLEEYNNIIYYLNTRFLSRYHLSGIISVVPSSVIVTLGTVVGDILRSEFSHSRKFLTLLILGVGTLSIGWLWSIDIMFSKSIWTPSYVLFSSGIGCIILSLFYYLIEIREYRSWGFVFKVFGMNAITAYFVSIVVRVHTLEEWCLTLKNASDITLKEAIISRAIGSLGLYCGSWAYTLGYVSFWWLVLFIMYRRKIFVRI
ncbi:MAG: DUF5009 domain-containing protein [Candidatus Neomarinimicrobiota bacterium]|nr:DUF5009 domain-containing protein [Candidatus Neomarinimicrobiota bacterium]RKY53382.1 MAG: DUF5009 domain-containing protein [Candidatus Neomarinimicrobiota bacterium]